MRELSSLRSAVEAFAAIDRHMQDAHVLIELIEESDDKASAIELGDEITSVENAVEAI